MSDYALAFMTGLLGGGHCIGMCGALVSAFFLKFAGQASGPAPYVAYHAARIGVYTLVGVLAALLGTALVATGAIGAMQGLLRGVAGLVMILLGLDVLGYLRLHLSFCGLSSASMKKWFLSATQRGPVLGGAMGGLLNGLMPCALVFAMAIKATTAAGPLEGGLLLLAFGLGTLPTMLFVSVALGRLGLRVRSLLLKGAAMIVILMGVIAIGQGIDFFNIMRGLMP